MGLRYEKINLCAQTLAEIKYNKLSYKIPNS